jgi:hypothetical protein
MSEFTYLPPKVAEKFEVVGIANSPVQLMGRFGKIDFRQMTVAQAERLLQSNAKFIRRKPVAKSLAPAKDDKK